MAFFIGFQFGLQNYYKYFTSASADEFFLCFSPHKGFISVHGPIMVALKIASFEVLFLSTIVFCLFSFYFFDLSNSLKINIPLARFLNYYWTIPA